MSCQRNLHSRAILLAVHMAEDEPGRALCLHLLDTLITSSWFHNRYCDVTVERALAMKDTCRR